MSEDELGPELEAMGRMPVQPWSLVLLKRIAPK
jgi:hypothetical protein